MSDPKQQQDQQVGDDQLAEDLTLQDEQAENVRGGESVSLNYGSIKYEYQPQK